MSKPFESYKVKPKHGDTQKLSLQIKMIEEDDVNKITFNYMFKGAEILSSKYYLPHVSDKKCFIDC